MCRGWILLFTPCKRIFHYTLHRLQEQFGDKIVSAIVRGPKTPTANTLACCDSPAPPQHFAIGAFTAACQKAERRVELQLSIGGFMEGEAQEA